MSRSYLISLVLFILVPFLAQEALGLSLFYYMNPDYTVPNLPLFSQLQFVIVIMVLWALLVLLRWNLVALMCMKATKRLVIRTKLKWLSMIDVVFLVLYGFDILTTVPMIRATHIQYRLFDAIGLLLIVLQVRLRRKVCTTDYPPIEV